MLAKRGAEAISVFAVIPRQPLLRLQILESDLVPSRQPVILAQDQPKILGKQRPAIKPLPALVELGGDAEFSLALLEHLGDLAAIAAQEPQFQAVELALDLIEERNEQRQVDRVRERDPQGADLTALEGGRERARAGGRIIALLEQGMHTLAEFGQLR